MNIIGCVIDRDADTDAGIENRNRIIDQTPEPGAALDHDDVITLTCLAKQVALTLRFGSRPLAPVLNVVADVPRSDQ